MKGMKDDDSRASASREPRPAEPPAAQPPAALPPTTPTHGSSATNQPVQEPAPQPGDAGRRDTDR
jgi:hypothetical protein